MAAMIETKTVKIPKSMDPFYVEINGEKFSYPAGTEQEVPLDVAAVIENIEGNTPKTDPRAGEPSFESLRDRPFGEELEVLFEQTVVFEGEEEGGWQMEQALPISFGDHVKVTFDGTVYECEAFKFDAGIPGAVFFGNPAAFDGEDNGAPFLAATSADAGMTMFMGDPGTHSIKIEKVVVQKLDPKYIPDGVGGGVVIVQDSAMASGVMPVDQDVPTATMNAAEIAEAVFAGKNVYFCLYGSTLIPFSFGFRFPELQSGVMTAAGLPEPYALFSSMDANGYCNMVEVYIDGEYWECGYQLEKAK